MRYKREHQYTLQNYEEKLYKEVVYDARPDLQPDEVRLFANPLKKSKTPTKIRNSNEMAE